MRHFLHGDKYYIAMLLILLVVYPIFFRLDFSKSSYELFDIIYMVPIYSWFYLAAICLFLSLYVMVRKKIGLTHVLAAIFLIWGLYVISQYPSIMNGDVFVHEAFTKRVILQGGTQNVGWYPQWWPGAFILQAVTTEVTGFSLIDQNTILTYANLVALAFILFLLAKFLLGKKWAGLAVILYFVTNAFAFHWMGREHFVAQSLSFTLYLAALYLLTKIQSTRAANQRSTTGLHIMLILSITPIIVSHGFTSFMLICTLLGIMIIQRIKKVFLGVSPYLLLATITSWFGWWIFNSFSTFEKAVNYLLYSLGSFAGSKLARLSIPIVEEPMPLLGVILRNYYLKPMLVLVSLISIVALFKGRNSRKVTFYGGILIGVVLASIVGLSTSTGAIDIQLSEMMTFLTFPSSYLVAWLIAKRRKYVIVLSCIVICMIPISLGTMFTYHSEYLQRTYPQETYTAMFLANKLPANLTIGTDDYTSYLYAFFNENYTSGGVPLINGNLNYTSILEKNPLFFEGDVIVRSFKQEIIYNSYLKGLEERRSFWREVDFNLESAKNRVYDNGIIQVYEGPYGRNSG